MLQHNNADTIKQVGTNGQISLGKEYAGKQVLISKLDDNSLIIKTGKFIPDNEKWLYEEDNLERLKEAIKWATTHERRDNFEEIKKLILESQDND
jgi:hypothetical protein